MPVVALKSGIAFIAMLFLLMSNMIGITLDEMIQTNDKMNKENMEIIKNEIEDLVDDYVDFCKRFLPEYMKENADYFADHKPTKDDLADFKEEALDFYIEQQEYVNLYITEMTYEYMKNHLPKEDKNFVKINPTYFTNYNRDEYIIRHYIRNIVNKN